MIDLMAEYHRLCDTPSDIYMHLPRFVEMVEALDAQHVIELGTRTGVSTVAFLLGLETTGGRLTSIDIDERPDIGPFDSDTFDAWEFIHGSDLDPSIVGQLDEADLIFIDTSHAWAQTLQELYVYDRLVKPGGLLVLHDTELLHPLDSPASDPPFPVRAAVTEFCAEQSYEFKLIRECNGLGIVRIPAK